MRAGESSLRERFASDIIDRRMRQHHYYVYILHKPSGVLYTGMTNDIERRMYEHKHKLVPGFTEKYNVTRLVYYELYGEPRAAIEREKEIKGWLRRKKLALIRSTNPAFRDISEDWSMPPSSRA